MPDTNTETGNIARDSEFRSLIENGRIEDVPGYIDRSVKRNRSVIDQRSERSRFYRNAANCRTMRWSWRSRDGGVQNRIALEFARIRSGRRGSSRLRRRHFSDFLSQLGVFFFDLVESRHHVIECCRSRRTSERDQAKSSTSRPGKKLIPHDVSPFAKLSRQQAGTPLNGAMLGYTRCQIHRLTR